MRRLYFELFRKASDSIESRSKKKWVTNSLNMDFVVNSARIDLIETSPKQRIKAQFTEQIKSNFKFLDLFVRLCFDLVFPRIRLTAIAFDTWTDLILLDQLVLPIKWPQTLNCLHAPRRRLLFQCHLKVSASQRRYSYNLRNDPSLKFFPIAFPFSGSKSENNVQKSRLKAITEESIDRKLKLSLN
jgi:hypothetical protein